MNGKYREVLKSALVYLKNYSIANKLWQKHKASTFRPSGIYNVRILTYFVSRPKKKLKIIYSGEIPRENWRASIATPGFGFIFEKCSDEQSFILGGSVCHGSFTR